MNEKWYKSVVALLAVIMLLVQAILVVYMVGINPAKYDQMDRICNSIVAGGVSILVIIFMVLSLKNKKAGPIIGMTTGLAYVYKFTVPALLVGATYFIFSLGLLVELGKANEPKKDKEVKKQKA